jgi:G3E family GTPase
MADPGPVASVFWLDDISRLRLDGIVGVVDAKNILKQLEDTASVNGGGEEAARQIGFADRILVNKIDLVDRENIHSVLEAITSINPTAPTLLTTFSTMEDLNWVLDTQCFDPERVRDVEATYEQLVRGKCNLQCMCSMQYCRVCNSGDNGEDTASATIEMSNLQHRHTSAISTIALFNIGSLDLHKLNSWLASILWPNQDEMDSVLRAKLEQIDDNERIETNNPSRDGEQQYIYRIKGVVSISRSSNQLDDENSTEYICLESGLDRRRYIVQAVNDIWDVTPASDSLCWKEEETRCCKIVVIGKWLDEERLRKEFEECFIAK